METKKKGTQIQMIAEKTVTLNFLSFAKIKTTKAPFENTKCRRLVLS